MAKSQNLWNYPLLKRLLFITSRDKLSHYLLNKFRKQVNLNYSYQINDIKTNYTSEEVYELWDLKLLIDIRK